MDSINDALAEVLRTVQTPGDFCAAGNCPMHLPLIEVDGVGPIALPLLPAQAAQLIAVAERAPYGRGGETLVDTAVRRTWQIGADRVRIAGKHWPEMLATVVERAACGLGAGTDVAPELYKLLVYDEGSFFVSHRDTEKSAGMCRPWRIVSSTWRRSASRALKRQTSWLALCRKRLRLWQCSQRQLIRASRFQSAGRARSRETRACRCASTAPRSR